MPCPSPTKYLSTISTSTGNNLFFTPTGTITIENIFLSKNGTGTLQLYDNVTSSPYAAILSNENQRQFSGIHATTSLPIRIQRVGFPTGQTSFVQIQYLPYDIFSKECLPPSNSQIEMVSGGITYTYRPQDIYISYFIDALFVIAGISAAVLFIKLFKSNRY